MYFLKRVWLFIPLLLFCPGLAQADDTTIGVTINGTTGHHLATNATQTVPLVPLPMFKIEHTHKNLRLRIEGVPPIGPVALASGGFFDSATAPRVSFLSADALYTLPGRHFAVGLGETIVNQRTFYEGTGMQQASRIVGARYTLQALVFTTPFGRLDASIALNPSMHGVQYTIFPAGVFFAPSGPLGALSASDGEAGSMVDGALGWSLPMRRSTFVYGLRYINYTAKYSSNGNLADHNHLLMPYIGVDLHLRSTTPHDLSLPHPVLPAGPRLAFPRNQTRIGLSILGMSGSHASTFSSPTVTPFGLSPDIRAFFALGQPRRTFRGNTAGGAR